jgi:fructokinase
MENKLFGAVEAGGTKFVCAVGSGPDRILAEERFATTDPAETIGHAIEFFRRQERSAGRLAALGIGAFGPVELDPDSGRYGWITSTPKPGWANTDLVTPFHRSLNLPVSVETDVNAAALGEGRWGAGHGLHTFLYLTIGTGIGGGCLVHGRPLHGLLHPEMGHIHIPHDESVDPFEGACPFHGDCLEGLANGPAIERRWHMSPPALPDDHPAWPLEAHYLALALATFICTLSPQRVILGGGVMQRQSLFPLVRAEVVELLHGYVQSPAILDSVDDYIVPPALGPRAGVLGALALAEQTAAG